MNEVRSYPSTSRFDPPEEGVMPGESIVWTRRAGSGFWVIFFGFIIVIGGPALVVVGIEEFGLAFTYPFLLLAFAGIIAVIASLVQTRRTRYYLTSDRILKVRAGTILKEIPLSHFTGKPISQFIDSGVTHRSNNRPVYRIRIYDPTTDEVMEFRGLDMQSVKAFERVGDIRECSYCNYDNPAAASVCRNCDAVL
jgi:hypothetical protein